MAHLTSKSGAANQAGSTKVVLTPVNRDKNGEPQIFTFELNPSKMDIDYMSTYAPVPIAGADWLSKPLTLKYRPAVWVRNEAPNIQLEFMLASGIEYRDTDVENDIAVLESYRKKSIITGEPPDLVLQIGANMHIVRVSRMRVSPIMMDSILQTVRARVNLDFIVIYSKQRLTRRDRAGG